jgi:predicted acyltransferase (DUF342 family)
LTTRFPNQIDNFSIKAPQETILASHINDIQESIIAIEVFVKSIEQNIDIHIASLQAHSASSIMMSSIVDLDTTSVQKAIEDLKQQLDQAIIDLGDVTNINLSSHIGTSINSAHPNGKLPGSRIEDGSITGTQIGSSTIQLSHLQFDVATQVELDGHQTSDIETAHPNGLFPISRLDTDVATTAELDTHKIDNIAIAHPNGLFPISRLDTDVATEAELITHSNKTTDIHGIVSPSTIVGTKTSQILEYKKILSDYQGTKIVLFIDGVSDLEKQVYDNSDVGANQFEVRQKSTSSINSVLTSGTQTILSVPDGLFFSDIVDVVDGLKIISPPSTVITLAKVVSATSSQITLDSIYPVTTANLLINTVKAEPLFSIGSQGEVTVKQLNVSDSTFTDVNLDDNVTILGTLQVQKTTQLGDDVTISGAANIAGDITGNSLQVNNLISGSQIVISGNNTTSGTLTVGSTGEIGGSLTVHGSEKIDNNLIVDGYTNIASSITVGGQANIQANLSVGNSIFGRSLDITDSGSIGNNLTVDNDLYVSGSTIIATDLTVQGNFNISGAIEGLVDGYYVVFHPEGTNLTSITGQQAIVEVQANLEKHLNDGYAHDAYEIIFDNTSSSLTSIQVEAAIKEVQTNLENHLTDSYAHDAYEIVFNNTSSALTSIQVEAAIKEVQTNLENHVNLATDAHDSSAISVIDNFNIVGADTNTQKTLEAIDGYCVEIAKTLDETIFIDGAATSSTGLIGGNINFDVNTDGYTIIINGSNQLAVGPSSIDSQMIDWGLSGNQASAEDIPIRDADGYYAATDLEGALKEIYLGLRQWKVVDSSPYYISPGEKLFINTSSTPIDGYLPTTAITGDTIIVCDPEGTWGTNNFNIIATLPHTIESGLGTTPNLSYEFVFYSNGSINKWIVRRTSTFYGI